VFVGGLNEPNLIVSISVNIIIVLINLCVCVCLIGVTDAVWSKQLAVSLNKS
jgi:hypothetical protein